MQHGLCLDEDSMPYHFVSSSSCARMPMCMMYTPFMIDTRALHNLEIIKHTTPTLPSQQCTHSMVKHLKVLKLRPPSFNFVPAQLHHFPEVRWAIFRPCRSVVSFAHFKSVRIDAIAPPSFRLLGRIPQADHDPQQDAEREDISRLPIWLP